MTPYWAACFLALIALRSAAAVEDEVVLPPLSTHSHQEYSNHLTLQGRRLDNVIGESTGFKVEQPFGKQSCSGDWCSLKGEYVHAEGLFGVPSYGAAKKIVGRLHYVTPEPNNTGCTTDYDVSYVADDDDKVFLVDRGDCHFVEKVRIGEQKGAAAVIIADNDCMCADYNAQYTSAFDQLCEERMAANPKKTCSNMLPFMADDGSGEDIGIPSFLITLWEAQRLKDCYNTAEGRVTASESITGVVCRADQPIIVSLQWDMPSPDGNVEWDLWTNSDDPDDTSFKEKFKHTAELMAPYTTFTPHYFIWDGERWHCTGAGQICSTQCTHEGRYCSVDPDQQLHEGVSGADVVEENLRQLCIWKQANTTARADGGSKWWNYVIAFTKKCHANQVADADTFNEACSRAVHAEVGLDWADTLACIAESDDTPDGSNTLLQAELDSRMEKNILMLPTVVVNRVILRGGVTPVSVLSTICSGYPAGLLPDLCACVETHSKDDVLLCTQSQCPTSELPFFCSYNNECTAAEADCQNLYPGSSGVSVAVVIVIVVAVAGAVGGAGLVYWRRAKAQMRAEVRNILAEYMPLEEIPADPTKGSASFVNEPQPLDERDSVGLI